MTFRLGRCFPIVLRYDAKKFKHPIGKYLHWNFKLEATMQLSTPPRGEQFTLLFPLKQVLYYHLKDLAGENILGCAIPRCFIQPNLLSVQLDVLSTAPPGEEDVYKMGKRERLNHKEKSLNHGAKQRCLWNKAITG